MKRLLGKVTRPRPVGLVVGIVTIAALGLMSSASAAAGAKLAITPSSWNFGSVLAGGSSSTKQFTVTNTGGATSGNVVISLSGTDLAQIGRASCRERVYVLV